MITVGLGIITAFVLLVGVVLTRTRLGWRTTVRRWGATAAALVLAAFVVAAVGLVVERPLPRQHRVAMPAASASPTVVVQTYLKALDAHDDKTAQALTVPGSPAGEPGNDYIHVALVRAYNVRTFTAKDDDCCSAPGVSMQTVQRATWRDGGEVTSDGDYQWGYELIRSGSDRAWRIYDEGTG